jgi:hypothetical protein
MFIEEARRSDLTDEYKVQELAPAFQPSSPPALARTANWSTDTLVRPDLPIPARRTGVCPRSRFMGAMHAQRAKQRSAAELRRRRFG